MHLNLKLDEQALKLIQGGCMYIFGRDKYFRPAFVFDGFRFVEYIEKYPGLVTPENIVRAFVFLCNYLKEVMFLDGHEDYFNYIAYMNNLSPTQMPRDAVYSFASVCND